MAIDLSGDSLHRRGYRRPGEQVEAPLKETLAAAVLLRAGWPAVAAVGGSVVDPLCGSGTLPIEAALQAADVAPGLLREAAGADGPHWGFLGWRGHDAALWKRLVAQAGERSAAALARLRAARSAPEGKLVPVAYGYDRDARAIALARDAVDPRRSAGARAHRGPRTGEARRARAALRDRRPHRHRHRRRCSHRDPRFGHAYQCRCCNRSGRFGHTYRARPDRRQPALRPAPGSRQAPQGWRAARPQGERRHRGRLDRRCAAVALSGSLCRPHARSPVRAARDRVCAKASPAGRRPSWSTISSSASASGCVPGEPTGS